MKNWHGKRVFITGGSKGLGRALAIYLSERGAKVAIIGRDKLTLNSVKAAHPQIEIIEGDVSDKQQMPFIASTVITMLGGIDILINNASSLGPAKLHMLIDTECEDFELALQTNLLAPFRLIKSLIAPMLLQKQGIVINITSDAAVNSYAEWGAYGASKAALEHLTKTYAAELSEKGIQFYAIDPGDMDTDLHRQALPEADSSQLRQPEHSAAMLINLLEENSLKNVRVSL